MSRDNFKDDFEKNRQSIDSNDQFDRVNNETNDEIDNFHQEMHKDDKEEETNLLVVTKNLTIRLMIMKKVH